MGEIELNLTKDFNDILLWVKQKLFLLEYKKMSILVFKKKNDYLKYCWHQFNHTHLQFFTYTEHKFKKISTASGWIFFWAKCFYFKLIIFAYHKATSWLNLKDKRFLDMH